MTSNNTTPPLPTAIAESLLKLTTSMVVVLSGTDHRIAWASRRFQERVGQPKLVGRPLLEILPNLSDKLPPLLNRALREKPQDEIPSDSLSTSFDYVEGDQTFVWHAQLQPVRAEEAEGPVQILMLVQESTDIPSAHCGPLQTQDLAWLCELSQSLLAVCGPDGRYVRINRMFSDILGWSREEILAQPVLSFVHDHDKERTARELDQLVAGQQTSGFQNRIKTYGGHYRWIEWSAASSPAEGVVYAVGRDVTDAKQASEALQREVRANAFRLSLTDSLRALDRSAEIQREATRVIGQHFDATRVNVTFVDPDGHTIVVEQEYVQDGPSAIGAHPLEAFGKAFADEVAPGEPIVVMDLEADRRFSPEDRQPFEYLKVRSFVVVQLMRKDRVKAVLTVCSSEVRSWTDGEVNLFQEAAERVWDAIQRTEAEEALQQANVELVNNDKRKDEFLAMLAHELRNPLAAVSNAVQLLEATHSDERSRRYLEVLNRQARSLNDLVDDLLDVSRVTRGLIKLKQERVDISTVVQHALECAHPQLEKKRLQVTVDRPGKPIPVLGDETRLGQVFINLLVNAAKYSDTGGSVLVTVRTATDTVEIGVRDTGIGIAEESRTRIFSLFGQAERGLDRAQGGLGIGLTIAKTLVELHGGDIKVQSEGLGRGAEFTVVLPIAPADPSDEEYGPSTNGGKRILVVEDNPDVAETLSLLLEHAGHHVTAVTTGPEALEVAEKTAPEFVLLDIGLPGMDGYEVARRLRQSPSTRTSKLAALTGYGQESDRLLAESAGFDAHFVKPVNFENLQAFIAGPQQ